MPPKEEINVELPTTYVEPLEQWIFENILATYNVPGIQVVLAF